MLYWSDRVGKGNRIFRMPRFRTMRIGTPAVAAHLLAPRPHRFDLLPGDPDVARALFHQQREELRGLVQILLALGVGERIAFAGHDQLVEREAGRIRHVPENTPPLTTRRASGARG